MSIIIFIIILLVLVVSHEFGHYIVAKKSGIRVDEFSFGFPPKLFGKKIGETTYNFNALPLGGYVKIFGENPDEDSINGPDSKRSFVNKPKYIQMAVLLAGVVMNFLVAWLLISVGFISGLPTSVDNTPKGAIVLDQKPTIIAVLDQSPADIAGLKPGDKIIALSKNNSDSDINLDTVFGIKEIQEFINKNPNAQINVSILRGPDPLVVQVIPESKDINSPALIGISMDLIGTLKLPIHRALWEGMKLTINVTIATVIGFYNLITDAFVGQADVANLTGPIGIISIVGDATHFGFVYLLSFTALISINLAVLNLIPFPALDGGRLLFLLIEKIKGSRIRPQIANWVNTIGFGLLMLLMVFITYNDIIKLF
jgi:regulator of sigma E protease